MEEIHQNRNLIEKISKFETIEIWVNEKKEMVFEGIIDPPYIHLHFERIVKTSKDFDIVKMIGYYSNKSKELITEMIVSTE